MVSNESGFMVNDPPKFKGRFDDEIIVKGNELNWTLPEIYDEYNMLFSEEISSKSLGNPFLY